MAKGRYAPPNLSLSRARTLLTLPVPSVVLFKKDQRQVAQPGGCTRTADAAGEPHQRSPTLGTPMRSSPLPKTFRAPAAPLVLWSTVVEALTRPYRVTASMVILVGLLPLYTFIPALFPSRKLHVPNLPLDRFFPLQPTWAIVYGSLYLFLILLPVLVVRQEGHIRRTIFAYLTVWLIAYASFLAYPTVAPRAVEVIGEGFGAWGLRLLYSADPPYNCFPSLHVAHSFVSALTCLRLHRGLGTAAVIAASLVGLSTLYTKQHYILDVTAGIFLAALAYILFLHNFSAEVPPEPDRRAAPVLAIALLIA